MFNTGFAGAKVVADASKLEGGVSSIDKNQLMEETSELLKSLDGTMFTGCDMNTTLDDMSCLADKVTCVYVTCVYVTCVWVCDMCVCVGVGVCV